MANRNKGEVSAKIAGTEYVFRIATNEWCGLEDEYQKTTDELVVEFQGMAESGKLNMRLVRSFFRASLAGSNPAITHEEAGTLMSNMGLVQAADLLGKVISASMPDVQEDKSSPRPPKAAKA